MDARWKQAADALAWDRPPDTLFVDDPTGGRWFPGGRINGCVNLVDRHLPDRADQLALFWEGEPGDRRELTYRQLHDEVVAIAEALTGLGLGPGDRVALHAGLLPETIATLLACMRVGATFSVLPSVLPPEPLAARLADLQPRVLVTQDAAWRHGVLLPLKARADEALAAAGSVEHTIVVRRTGVDVPWFEGDRWLHDLLAGPRPGVAAAPRPPIEATPVDADHPMLVSYHANRRGRPAGIVHSTGGLLAYSLAVQQAIAPEDDSVVWSPAEFAWLACQTHGILGPLAVGCTAVAYEGMLDTPSRNRAWDVVERCGVTTLLATPSVLRAVRRLGDTGPDPAQVTSLRLVVTAGEPLEEDTDRWLRHDVGQDRVPVVNAWGQAELGGLVHADRPPLAGRLPAAGLAVVDEAGRPAPPGTPGDLIMTEPWPAQALTSWGGTTEVAGADPDRPGVYVTGDRAVATEDGLVFLGRSDHVFSVSGQLVSATEVETVLLEHPFVRAAIVVDRPDQHTGRAVVACVATTDDVEQDEAFAGELRAHVRELLGGLSQPRSVVYVEDLPSGVDTATARTVLATLTTGSGPVEHVSRQALGAAVHAVRPPD